MANYTSIHPYIEESLEFLIEKFKNKEQFEENEGFGTSTGTYTLLLVGCCTYIESFLDFSLRAILRRVKQQQEDLEYFNKKIDKAGFKDSQDIFLCLTHYKIKELINDDELWKAIDNLFQLRNSLVHGQSIFFDIEVNRNPEFKKKFKNLSNYLENRHLIKKEVKEGEHFIEKFISEEILNFFSKKD